MTEEELRYMDWLGELADVCTRNMTGQVCSYCRCSHRDSDRNPEDGDAVAAPSRSDESAVAEGQSPNLHAGQDND